METLRAYVSTLPHLPGVYIYRNTSGETLYVGKAKDLKKRVSQYFQRREAVGEKTETLVSQIHAIQTITTASEFDALLLEAKLIREKNPKYNVISRDDKSPLYVAITMNETLPRLLWIRKTSLSLYPKAAVFGPFQSGYVARHILRDLRRVYPYCMQKKRTGKPCFYTHLGLCHPCPSAITGMSESEEKKRLTSRYRTNIRAIASILSGRSLTLLHALERDMHKKARAQAFEQAQELKEKVSVLQGILSRRIDPNIYTDRPTVMTDQFEVDSRELARILVPYYPDLGKIRRVECVDISNTQGTDATGSFVVFIDGFADTSAYRRFKIRSKKAPDDTAMMREVLTRRLRHTEWNYPELLVVDGGKGQTGSAVIALAAAGVTIPVIGLAKRFEEIIVPVVGGWKTIRLPVSNPALQLLMRIRDESHRFALRYHRHLRTKAFLSA